MDNTLPPVEPLEAPATTNVEMPKPGQPAPDNLHSLSAEPTEMSGDGVPSPPTMGEHRLRESKSEVVPVFQAQREDYFLWFVITAVLTFVATYFWRFSTAATTGLNASIARLTCLQSEPDSCAPMYGHLLALTSLSAILVRSNGAFLVGTLVCLIGCTIVLRRIRVDFKGEGGSHGLGGRLATDSPGLVVAVLGAAILLATILKPPSLEFAPSTTSRNSQSIMAREAKVQPNSDEVTSMDQIRELEEIKKARKSTKEEP